MRRLEDVGLTRGVVEGGIVSGWKRVSNGLLHHAAISKHRLTGMLDLETIGICEKVSQCGANRLW